MVVSLTSSPMTEYHAGNDYGSVNKDQISWNRSCSSSPNMGMEEIGSACDKACQNVAKFTPETGLR